MAFDSITNYGVVKQLKKELIGSKISKIYQPSKDEVVIHTFSDKKLSLLLNASSNNPRVHFIEDYNNTASHPKGFCMLLRKYLTGGIIKDISLYNFDRIIHIDMECINLLGDFTDLRLIIEIMGRHSNIILIEKESNQILDSIKHVSKEVSSFRQILPKEGYISPPSDRLNPLDFDEYKASDRLLSYYDKTLKNALVSTFNGFSPIITWEILKENNLEDGVKISSFTLEEVSNIVKSIKEFFYNLDEKLEYNIYYEGDKPKDFLCIDLSKYNGLRKENFLNPSLMIESYYKNFDRVNRLKQSYKQIFTVLESSLSREENKLLLREEEFKEALGVEIYNQKGQILLSNLHNMKKGDKVTKCLNFFSEEAGEIEIKLDPKLTPSENANKYFKLYTKGINAKKHLEKLIKDSEEMIYFLQTQILYLNNAQSNEDVDEIKISLMENKIIKQNKKNSKMQSKSKPIYVKHDDFDIYIGRNSKQNDELTRKLANKNDLWLHTKDIPSSHVIIRTRDGKYSKEALEMAMKLCVYYSKGRNSSNVPVDYTYIKYVKKPSGMKEGKVIYTDNKTGYITLENEDIMKIEKEV